MKDSDSDVRKCLGFTTQDGKIIEKDEKWLDRMIKSFTIYCQLIIQPEQTPFTLLDGWTWLANYMNLIARSPSGSVVIGGEVLDVFIRITSKELINKYKDNYINLLAIIQSQLLPMLPSDNTGTKRLEVSLGSIVSTKGQIIPAIYEDE